MRPAVPHFVLLALFNLGPGEILLVFVLIFSLFFADKLPGLLRGLDQKAHDLGKIFGGIYGKPAAQALTPLNQTEELYDPSPFRYPSRKGASLRNLITRCWRICTLVSSRIRALLGWRKRK